MKNKGRSKAEEREQISLIHSNNNANCDGFKTV
jgi:hypothetical protein